MKLIRVRIHATDPLVSAFLREYLRQNDQIVVVDAPGASEATVVDNDLLTPTEKRVLQKLSEHGTIHEVASELCCSERTVKTHLEHVYIKFGVRSAVQAVARAMRWGLLEEE